MKKLLALVLALVMSMSLVTISNAAYSDKADIDLKEAVDVLSAVGVFEGSDGKFDPKANLTREQAAIHPQKNLITRALGVSANIVPEYNRCEIEEGDILLLCTDGLTNMVSDDDIAQVLREVPFFDATSILVDRALQAGGQDNITVLLMGVETTEVNNG